MCPPGSDLAGQGVLVRDTALETLVNQYRQLNRDHVEPGGVFGGVEWNSSLLTRRRASTGGKAA